MIRKYYDNLVKTCMEIRVEGSIPVRRPRMTWLEGVEADMEELEIDRKYVYDIKKMETECYEEEVQSYRKTDYKPIIIIFIYTRLVLRCTFGSRSYISER